MEKMTKITKTKTPRKPTVKRQPKKDKVEHLYTNGKHTANEFYEEGLKRMQDIQDHLKEYSEDVIKTVKDKPLTSLLVAGGVGFIISSLLRK